MNIPLKPGYSTSEFWSVIIAGLSLVGLSAVSMLDVAWAATGVTILTALYQLSRHGLKNKQAQGELEALKTELALSLEEAKSDLRGLDANGTPKTPEAR